MTHVGNGAGGEAVVVGLVCRGGTGEHDVVAPLAPRLAAGGEIVRGAPVVAHLMRECQMGHPRRYLKQQ